MSAPVIAVAIFFAFFALIFFTAWRLHRKIKPRKFQDQLGANIYGSGDSNDMGKR